MDPKYIRVASDLHLEGFASKPIGELVQIFLPPDERDKESILVLAGDICCGADLLIAFLQAVEHRFFHVIYVPGNHEYYRYNMDYWDKVIPQRASTALHNTEFIAGEVQLDEFYRDDGSDHVRFISATLWGDGGKSLWEQAMIARYLNDFSLIWKYSDDDGSGFRFDRQFRVSDMIELNRKQRDMMENFLRDQQWKGKTIMVSHHMPSYTLCHPRFGEEANGGFASDCDLLIEVYKPDVWIHGHTHDTIDKKISDTRIVCNPAGYRGEWKTEFNTFAPKFIEI